MDEREITEDEGELSGDTLPAATADELFGDFEQARVLSSARRALFGRGEQLRIGRYVVERRLGAGGMGEVYLARDEELQRKVAVKRVLPGPVFGDDPRREQERLRREAQALARLTHPNVVGVYEFGEHQGRRFVAMEYVDGQTLAEWLGEEDRAWRLILDRFEAAGRGLAAAHAAGLVHRDFKPDNVLVSAAGEVRVADFGLVRTPGLAALAQAAGLSPERGLAKLSAEPRLSATGAVLGTVRYMPLEQLRASSEADARSDQFSFCVALYEALWRQPPFTIESLSARVEALELGSPRRPPRTWLPAGLWRAIRRGLAREPGDRWPSMDALLDALAAAPRRRRTLELTGAAVVVGALGLGWAAMAHEPAPSCAQRSARELAAVYDSRDAETIEARYAASSLDQAPALGERVRAGLDDWGQAWAQARTTSCAALDDHGQTTELRAQDACLARARRQAGALVELLVEVEVEDAGLARALDAVAQLPDPSACIGDDAALRVDPPPSGDTGEIAELRGAIERGHQLRLLGRYGEAREALAAVAPRVETLDYDPLSAELLAEQGKLELSTGALDRGVALLRAAIDAAEVGHHEALAAELWIELSLRTLGALDDAEAGRELIRRAEVASERLGAIPASARARLDYAEAQLLLGEGQTHAGEAKLIEAIDRARDHAPRDYPSYLARLARLRASDDLDASIELRRQALAAAEQRFGSAHPVTADFYYGLGAALLHAGDEAEARPLLELAISTWRGLGDQPSRKLAWAHQTLAELALADDDLELAAGHTEVLAKVQAATLPAGHRERATPELLFAAIAGKRNLRAEALTHCEAALAIWTPILPPDDARIIAARVEAVGHLVALDRLDEAVAEYEQIATHGDGQAVLTARLGAAELALMAGQPARAADQLEALDAAIAAGQLPALDDHSYTHALLWAIAELRRGSLGPARVAALAEARAAVPFTDEQLRAWFDDLGLDARERERLGLAR